MSRLEPCRHSFKRVILPTRPLFTQLMQYDAVIYDLGLGIKDFVEYTVHSWSRVEEVYNHGHVHMEYPITVPGLIHTFMLEDLLMPSGYMLLDVMERSAVVQVSHEICEVTYSYLYPYLDKLAVNQRLGVLHECLWLDDDLVLEIQL